MKKSLVIISFAFIFLLSMSIVSANNINQNERVSFSGWLNELWGKITGKVSEAESSPNTQRDASPPSNPINICFDSDGNNITNKGNVTTSNNPISVDSCASSSSVTEYTCFSPLALQATATNVLCPSGYSCNNGACKKAMISGIGIGTPVVPIISCNPNYIKTSCVNDVAVFKDNQCNSPDYTAPYDCDGNGIISGDSCSGVNLDGEGGGVSIDFLSFDSSTNYSGMGNKTIQLAENYQGVEFDWDFSNEFNFCGVSLETSGESDKFGYVLFNYSDGEIEDKIAFVDRINKSNRVCIKDSSVKSISEISAKCNAPAEILINCPGNFTLSNPTYNYNCTITPDGLQYQVWPLKHSAVKEMTGLVVAGQQTACVENWNCSDWSDAVNQCGIKTCVDLNNCGTMFDKPLEEQSCDLNGETGGERISAGNPPELQKSKGKSILFITLGIVGLILLILLSIYFVKRKKSDEEDSENQSYSQSTPPRSPPSKTNVYAPKTSLAPRP